MGYHLVPAALADLLFIRLGAVLLLVLPLLSSCNSGDIETFPLKLARRSVLDQQVRMLTLRFGDDRFVVYDLQNSKLYKVWRGGVLWNGAAFNNMKTIQPESYGAAYLKGEEEEAEWSFEKDGERRVLTPAFRAYRLWEDGISLEFLLSDAQGNEFMITESPRFEERVGEPHFLRDFRIVQAPAGSTLYYGALALHRSEEVSLDNKLEVLPQASAPANGGGDNSSQYWLERSGCNTCHDLSNQEIGPSYEAIASRYTPEEVTVDQLVAKVQEGGSGLWGPVAMIPHPHLDEPDIKRMVRYILSLRPKIEEKTTAKPAKPVLAKAEVKKPGFGAPLEAVHPAYDLITIRPDWFKPRVGGMAFLPDGALLLTTWDSTGAVYALHGVSSGDTNQIKIRQIASGLAEPLGLTTVGTDIYVLQKHELTQLIDLDQDGLVDEYRSVNHSFGVSPDFHEFSYGLAFQDGYFYGGLGLAMRLMSHEVQLADRGTIFKIGLDGSFEKIAAGLRQPNGISIGPEQEIFVTENQGQWVPACKFIHIRPGNFYGCRFGAGDRHAGREATPPAVWMPQDEIGNSPSQPLLMRDGPYKGQMIYGEVTHGGLKRVFLEKVDGEYQGCVFRFSQGLEAGINRMAWGPDGGLYVGGVGMNGNWAHQGHQYGLQKLVYNNKVPFELLAVRALADGFELEFTEQLPEQVSGLTEKIKVRQWYYEATAAYGGPKLDETDLPVTAVTLSADGKKLQLQIPGLKQGYVVYFLLDPDLRSRSGSPLWTGESWYTLNRIPSPSKQETI